MRNQRGEMAASSPSPGGGSRNSSRRLRGAREPEDDLGEIGVAAEGAIRRRHRGIGIEAEQIAIGLVRIEHAARAVGDQGALRQIVDEGLGDVVARVTLPKMENADSASEQAEHADHREAG